MTMPFVVRESPIHGKGAFATRAIDAGRRIGEYTGERITRGESARRNVIEQTDENHPANYRFALDDELVIDGLSGGNDTRFINHGCDPNCVARHEDGRIFLDARRDIHEGDELLLDYKMGSAIPIPDEERWRYACSCGAPSCRGTILRIAVTPEPTSTG